MKMNKPTMVVMAAGIGSRFGGLKQLAPVGIAGEPILKFSLYDAIKAGFEKVVFIIKDEIAEDFKNLIDKPIERQIEVEYVYQEIHKLPQGYSVPSSRIKPWGTGHAILCAKGVLDGPFAVINADDYYGKTAFSLMYDHLLSQQDDEAYQFSMVGYPIEKTLTDNGHVTRGVCKTESGFLVSIDERHRVEKHGKSIKYTEDEGKTWYEIQPGTTVSMNLWGFSQGFLSELENRFPGFLDYTLINNPIKGEYLLPQIVNDLLNEGKTRVKVLNSDDEWYGITYKEDLSLVQSAIRAMQESGFYPKSLFV